MKSISLNIRCQHVITPRLWTGIYLPGMIALLLRVASGPTAALSYPVLAVFALLGRVQAILALSLSWLFTMINPEIVAESEGGSAGRYLIILAASASAMFRSGFFFRHARGPRPFTLATGLLSAFFILHSVLFSAAPDVSILKAVSWGLTMTAIISLWQGLSLHELDSTADKIYYGLILVLIFSLPFLMTPAGFARNGTGFQGVLNHPQVLGSTMALLGAWSGARMFAEPRPKWGVIALAGASLLVILLSEARTSGLAMILGLGFSLVISPVFAGRSLIHIAPGFRSGRVWLTIGASIFTGLAMAAAFSEAVVHFLSKSGRGSSSNLLDAYGDSRGFLIDAMLDNIANNLFRGIGFGVASYPSTMIIERDRILGLPLGASVEKGVAPLAVLEEVGLFGAVLVALWLLWLLRKGAVSGLAAFAVCLTALTLNMGENTLFSPGGQGLLVMVLFGWVYASGERKVSHA